MLWGAIIVAAGRGTRFGGPKQLIELAGKPMALWSFEVFASMPEVTDIVVVTEPEACITMRALGAPLAGERGFNVVVGGAQRHQSVQAGLAALPERCNAVMVHDGARPLVRSSDIRNGMRVVREGLAALLAVPVTDTIKVVEGERRQVIRTLDRSALWAAQTPQFATANDLRRAFAQAAKSDAFATDDATLLERAGLDVIAVPGSPDNFKVTVPEDVVRAETVLRGRSPMLPSEEEILVLEAFVDDPCVDAVCGELASRGASIDAIDRDLPSAVVVRAFVAAERLRGFGERFKALTRGGGSSLYTTHFSHVAEREASR